MAPPKSCRRPHQRSLWLVVALHCTVLASTRQDTDALGCGDLFQTNGTLRDDPKCAALQDKPTGELYNNLPILDGVFCYNNGTGLCKAFSGRFEFYFNVWKQEFLGPVEESVDVLPNGYHKRMPTSYMIDGSVLYADRAINWARHFTRDHPTEYNLLSATSFNWCKYATSNNWPYKSSILDHDKVHQIYFYNRQSCIYNPQTRDLQHYNTRFLHTSKLRIDLDYNPTIFSMEDNLANETRLVKHKRQHWYESRWRLLQDPKPGIKYFVEMEPEERRPQIVDGRGPLLRSKMYEKTSKLCVSDYLASRNLSINGANSRLVASSCGLESPEIAVHMWLNATDTVYEIDLHSIPKNPLAQQQFYGVNVSDAGDWQKFAKDGFSFSATTTIPLEGRLHAFEVVSLFSYYRGRQPADSYDEHYPPTYLLRYNMEWDASAARAGGNPWRGIENRNFTGAKPLLNLNYVDDIAYLPDCKTILVIFGPLYSEYPAQEFNLETRRPLGSIHDLGANEMIHAFFAINDKLYFYHRLNYISEHTYKCVGPTMWASSARPLKWKLENEMNSGGPEQFLVTATKNGAYKFRNGPSAPPYLPQSRANYHHYEERHFQLLGLLKGSLEGPPDAPSVEQFPWQEQYVPSPKKLSVPSSIYYLVGLGLLGLLVMFALGFVACRTQRGRRRRHLLKTQRSELPDLSQLSALHTNRSAMDQRSRASNLGNAGAGGSTATLRSGRSASMRTAATGGGGGSSTSFGSSTASTATGRSALASSARAQPSNTGTTRSSHVSSLAEPQTGSSASSRSRSRSATNSRRNASPQQIVLRPVSAGSLGKLPTASSPGSNSGGRVKWPT